ncbi:MAG TPA: hypothetical protein VK666_23800 [Chryseolinea sp.]|nr:hypothetical protein [Chryseolinea sp.]
MRTLHLPRHDHGTSPGGGKTGRNRKEESSGETCRNNEKEKRIVAFISALLTATAEVAWM